MIFVTTSATAYFIAFVLQSARLFRKLTDARLWVLSAAAIAVVSHAVAVQQLLFVGGGIDLGFYKVTTMVALFFGALLVISAVTKPVENLFIALFPVSIFSLVLAATLASPYTPRDDFSLGILLHILVSVFAYSVMTIGAAHALLVIVQDRRLKAHHPGGMLWALPPLQTMERLLFEMLVVGMVMLTIAIGTGLVFVEDIFAQHLVHKTALTILAWCIYGILLWGHFQRGWRGSAAARWTLAGFGFLVLAFLGSKFVLELLLQRY